MIRKILCLVLAASMFLSFNAYAQYLKDGNYHSQIAGIHNQIVEAYNGYVHQKAEERKKALDALSKLGHTKKDKAARDKIFADCKKKEDALRENYKAKKKALLDKAKKLCAGRKAEKDKKKDKKKGECKSY